MACVATCCIQDLHAFPGGSSEGGGGEIAVDFLDISVSRFLLKMGVTNRCLKSRCFAVFVCLFVFCLFAFVKDHSGVHLRI